MAGIGPSIVSLITIWAAFPTWGLIVYPELREFPEWALAMTGGGGGGKAVDAVGVLANVTSAILNGTLPKIP